MRLMVSLYLLHIVSITIHELAHWFIACCVLKGYEEVRIGNIFRIRITKKIVISPFVLTGYVSLQKEILMKAKQLEIVLFFLAGPIANLILGIFLLYAGQGVVSYISGILNFVYFLCGLLPIPETDGFMMIKVLKVRDAEQGVL